MGSVTALRVAATTAPTAPCEAAPTTRPMKSWLDMAGMRFLRSGLDVMGRQATANDTGGGT
eukprot:CAMPEP_0206559026 /NCGR_PEP_ID=MMETSP0325_2-20121206/20134_1 /ASSEMBLY_ACC=CAM_ASM_000347 /TAXON_ID=2866 /ORGANISM="Crypthecodinium cohnii, Strain Seligo" /LENGTH=60 /DNA_ID=CAMNT_0054060419 /DNA_START=58 /DNA_END=240 /DNA_ORIENTATION=-